MLAQPYLNFDGRCEEALDFYRRTLDAEVTALMRFKDNPEVCASGMVPPGAEGKVMHSSFRIGDSTLMASDSGCGGRPNFEGVSLALTTANDDDAKRRFTALSDGGRVEMPLEKTFWAERFGMCVDRFGTPWMINCQADKGGTA